MLMACLEWFLWFAAFVYCLVKVFGKAEHWSIQLLCVAVGLAFAVLRYVAPLPVSWLRLRCDDVVGDGSNSRRDTRAGSSKIGSSPI